MLRLEISDFTFRGHKPYSAIANELTYILSDKFAKAKIKASIGYKNDVIFFKLIDKERNKLFSSTEENKVPLNPGDERIKKMGRDYLNTDRLTKHQEKKMWNECINGTLDSLGLSCNIKLYEHYDEDQNSFLLIREGTTIKDWPLQSKVYPIQK